MDTAVVTRLIGPMLAYAGNEEAHPTMLAFTAAMAKALAGGELDALRELLDGWTRGESWEGAPRDDDPPAKKPRQKNAESFAELKLSDDQVRDLADDIEKLKAHYKTNDASVVPAFRMQRAREIANGIVRKMKNDGSLSWQQDADPAKKVSLKLFNNISHKLISDAAYWEWTSLRPKMNNWKKDKYNVPDGDWARIAVLVEVHERVREDFRDWIEDDAPLMPRKRKSGVPRQKKKRRAPAVEQQQ